MRIVAGKYRGRKLAAPPGTIVRPTAARAREALFSILTHGGTDGPALAGARVVDLFAGTGALGLEALSRGAAFVTFVENEPTACRILAQNLEALGIDEEARVIRGDATQLPRAEAPCQLALLDPPYGSSLATSALESLLARGWIDASSQIVVECAAKETTEVPTGFRVVSERRYGAARFLFLTLKST
jgi:16S rRNA (guanine966-N2)-methyltransferase